MVGTARTLAPSTTNYDVGSATWADLRTAPLPSAMEVPSIEVKFTGSWKMTFYISCAILM
ncbi:hypothetical protein CR513_38467, partial [Mucuna pruriens]